MTFTKTVHLPVDVDEAFALITEPERLRRWQTVSARVDLRAGGDYRWTVTPGHLAVRDLPRGRARQAGRVRLGLGRQRRPRPRLLRRHHHPRARPTGGTSVTLVHEGLTAEQEVGHAEGWNHFLGRLEQAAATGDAGPDEWAAAPENLDQLVSAEATLAVLQPVLRNLTDEDRTKATPCWSSTATRWPSTSSARSPASVGWPAPRS